MSRWNWLTEKNIGIGSLILAFIAIVVDIANPEIRKILKDGWRPTNGSHHEENINPSQYNDLENLLKEEKWREADRETYSIIASKQRKDNLDSEALKQFPCSDLEAIDRLWVEYSKGYFGFSVQKRIWQKYDGKIKELGNIVGWREEDQWKGLDKIDFSSNAPEGHLPVLKAEVWGKQKGGFPLIFERCKKL